MSLFVLDTDILTLYRHGDPAVCRHVNTHLPDELATTVITVEEQLSGWYSLVRRAKRPPQVARAYQRLADSVLFLAAWQILSYTEPAITRYDQLRAMKLQVRTMDLRIAAITLEQAATLVTRNLR